MKILVTGATGFIGKHIVKAANMLGHELVPISRELENIDEPIEKAIHLAWGDVSNYMDSKNYQKNIDSQKVIIEHLLSLGVKDLTVAGTCLEYGKIEGECSEDAQPINISTTYAKAKLEIYDYLKTIPELKVKWGRVFYVYGEGSRTNSLLSLLLKAIENGDKEFNMSKGDQKRDFININTLANNIVATAVQEDITGIINWGNGRAISVLEFVQEILRIKNSNIKLNTGYYPYPDYEAFQFWADINKLKKIDGIKIDDKIWL